MTLPQRWRIIDFNQKEVEELQKQYNISEHFSKVLLNRKIISNQEIGGIFSPGLAFVHPPHLLPDIEIAGLRIEKAIKNGEKILLWGDEDTDGITATVFLYEVLKKLDGRVSYHIPSRKDEGIGLNIEGIKRAQEEGYTLIITVDCASGDFDEIHSAQKMGMDVIVTDHHEVPTLDGKNFALLNPKVANSSYPFPDIAGVTVAFKLGWFLTKRVLKVNDKEWKSAAGEWLPLVFLGTYADKVPLKNENWFLAKLGFNMLHSTKRKGIRNLIRAISKSGICDEMVAHKMISVLATAKTTGWMQNTGFNILTTMDEEYLDTTIPKLVKQSERWYAEASKNFRKVLSSLSGDVFDNVIFVYVPFVPSEYVSFCTSHLKERFSRSVIVVTDKNGLSFGEARTAGEFNIHELLSKYIKLFTSFGGHKSACGFTMRRENVGKLRQKIVEDFSKMSVTTDRTGELRIIGKLRLEDITEKLKDELMLLSPFGSGNPPPLFLARDLTFTKSTYTYEIPDTGEVKRIEMRGEKNAWIGINGQPISLDVVYYFNSIGTLIIADARPTVFNETITQT